MGAKNWATARQLGRYICIDPGEDTGFSLLEVNGPDTPVRMLRTASLKYNAQAIHELLCRFYYHGMDPSDGFGTAAEVRGLNTVILEKFVHRPGRPFNATAYKVMGICEAWHQLTKEGDSTFEYIERVPVQGKKEAPNDVLRKLGVYLSGHDNRHINDATRHGVSWLIENRHRGTALVAKPQEEEDD